MYTLKFTDDGLQDVKALPKNVRNALKQDLKKKLATDPYGSTSELRKPLEGWRVFSWGEHRVVLKIYDDLRAIAIAGIGERNPNSDQNVYKRLEALAVKGKLAEQVLLTLRSFTVPTSETEPPSKISIGFHPPTPHRIRRRGTHKSSSLS